MAARARGCQPDHRRLFDPERFHAVLFDQRGGGRSRPKGSREHNTLPHLIADMEMIREKFGFERWMVVGGSWGATLALAYAEAHPDRVSGLVLRATFLGTRAEVETAFTETLPRFYPGLYEDFLAVLPPDERARPVDAYWRRILDPDPAVHGPAARAWHDTERIAVRARVRAQRGSIWPRCSRRAPARDAVHGSALFRQRLLHAAEPAAATRPAGSPAFPASSCRAATTCCVRRRRRRRSATLWRDAEIRIVEDAGHIAVRSRRQGRGDEGDRGHGVRQTTLRQGIKTCRSPERACC